MPPDCFLGQSGFSHDHCFGNGKELISGVSDKAKGNQFGAAWKIRQPYAVGDLFLVHLFSFLLFNRHRSRGLIDHHQSQSRFDLLQ